MRSPRTSRTSHSRAMGSMCWTAPWRSEIAVTRTAMSVASAVVSSGEGPVQAIQFDFGHTLVDFQRTQEALHNAYEQIRSRIEAVAYMEVPELLDLVERVAGGVDRLVEEAYEQGRLQGLDQGTLLPEA